MTRAFENYIRACVNVAMDEPVGEFAYLYWLRKNGRLFYLALVK